MATLSNDRDVTKTFFQQVGLCVSCLQLGGCEVIPRTCRLFCLHPGSVRGAEPSSSPVRQTLMGLLPRGQHSQIQARAEESMAKCRMHRRGAQLSVGQQGRGGKEFLAKDLSGRLKGWEQGRLPWSWSAETIQMRRHFAIYGKEWTPPFALFFLLASCMLVLPSLPPSLLLHLLICFPLATTTWNYKMPAPAKPHASTFPILSKASTVDLNCRAYSTHKLSNSM